MTSLANITSVRNLNEAIMLAALAHHGQTDKIRMPYILHPLNVMHRTIDAWGFNEHLAMAAALHDVVEDTSVTLEMLQKAGCPQPVVGAVDCLSKKPEEEDTHGDSPEAKQAHYEAFIQRVARGPLLARRIKVADLWDNTSPKRAPANPTEKDKRRWAKYKKALDLLTPLTKNNSVVNLSVTSDGTNGPNWILRLEEKGVRLSDNAKLALVSPDFNPPSNKKVHNLVILRGETASKSTLKQIQTKAESLGLINPNPEIACLFREALSNEELSSIDVKQALVMHKPLIKPLHPLANHLDEDDPNYRQMVRESEPKRLGFETQGIRGIPKQASLDLFTSKESDYVPTNYGYVFVNPHNH